MKKQQHAWIMGVFITISFTSLQAQQVTEGFAAPESVIKNGNKLFVSSINGNPAEKDGNGFISELSADGKVLQQKFQKTVLNAPKGMAIINNILYVTDIDRIVGFNTSSGEQVFELTIDGAGFLNDLCKAGDNQLAVTESMGNKVYLVNPADKKYSFAGTVAGANGVTYDAKTKQLFACGMGDQMNGNGKLYVKDINSKDTVFTELQNSPTGVFDGLELTDDNHLLVSDWVSFTSDKGRLIVYDLKAHTSTVYTYEAGAADITYDKATKKIYIPQMPKNRLVIVGMGELKKE